MRRIIATIILMNFVIVPFFTSTIYCHGITLNRIVKLDEIGLSIINKSCRIKKRINLKGCTLELPQGVTLHFLCKGKIVSGTIIGHSNSLRGYRKKIFDNIEIKGDWQVESINTEMFTNCSAEKLLQNITNLCSDQCKNSITIEDKIIVSIPLWTSYLILKSNTDLYLKSSIKALPSQHKGGWLITVRGENIRLYGGGNLIEGDMLEQKGNRPECLHAIFVDRSSTNVTFKDLVIQYFWGDGFSSQGSNILFENIEIKHNGRQGISLTNGNNIEIRNCYFHDMGRYGINEAGGPGAGIDIEPGKNMRVDNVKISNCKLVDNFKYFNGYINDLEIYETRKINLTVVNCIIGGLYLGSCENLVIKESEIGEPLYFVNEKVANVQISKCRMPNDVLAKAKKHGSIHLHSITKVSE